MCLQGILQYIGNGSRPIETEESKIVDWQLAQPGPFSLIRLAGAGCAQYTVSTTSTCNSTSAYIVDSSHAQSASGKRVPLSQLDASLSVTEPEGILTSSICDPDCEDKLIGLSDYASYDLVLDQDSSNECELATTFTAYDKNSPGELRIHYLHQTSCCSLCSLS